MFKRWLVFKLFPMYFSLIEMDAEKNYIFLIPKEADIKTVAAEFESLGLENIIIVHGGTVIKIDE